MKKTLYIVIDVQNEFVSGSSWAVETESFFIEKCIRLPRIEQLDTENYGL